MKNTCKHLKFVIKESYATSNSQVTCGGVDIKCINDNFESINHKNIYLGGELLDVDGECGGYNLHFAFSSGIKIANEISK